MTAMTATTKALRATCLALLAAGGMAGMPTAFAQGAAPGTDARMQRERAVCDGVQQDRAACLREAGAAQQEARRQGLTTAGPAGQADNALSRCQLQPPADRADCEARIRGTGQSSTEGSVMGGGVIRETVTPVPAGPNAPMAPMAPSPAATLRSAPTAPMPTSPMPVEVQPAPAR